MPVSGQRWLGYEQLAADHANRLEQVEAVLEHAEVAGVLGCEVARVKALVFRARSGLIERRDARDWRTGNQSIAELAESVGQPHDRILISAKVSQVQDLVDVYRRLASRCDYPLHLGLTEAGLGTKGVVTYGVQALPGISTIYYRVTIRVKGPRNTLSYVQAILN